MILDEGVGFFSKKKLNKIYQLSSPSTEKKKIFQPSFENLFRKFDFEVSGASIRPIYH